MRVGRGTRWVIGIAVTSVLALLSLIALVVAAFVTLLADIDLSEGDLTGRAPATVLDVDRVEGDYDDWVWVDVRFTTAAGENVVTSFDWPYSLDEPAAGDLVEVAYDPTDPEYAAEASTAAPPSPSPEVLPDADARPGFIFGAVCGVLSLLALVTTIVWATRAPKPQARPIAPYYPPRPPYPYPPPPYPPHLYPRHPYPRHPYPAPYPPPHPGGYAPPPPYPPAPVPPPTPAAPPPPGTWPRP